MVAAGCTSVVADARTFEGTEWRVTAVNGQPSPPGLSLRFSGGELSGYLGCNRFSGPYRITGNVLTVATMATTLMACEPALDEPRPIFEPAGLAVLSSPMRITWRSGRELTLSNAAGSIALQKTP
jgi:heat shock protein HslJ